MKYHYVYKITNKISGKMYIGARSCNVEPEKDIGVEYFSSSGDEEFKSDQRNNPDDYIYDVIKWFDCRDDASNFEIKLHNEFDVGKNPLFYNKAKQTSTGFSTYGKTHSDETRKKMSDVKKGKMYSDETRKKMSDAAKGKTHSDETRKKISDAVKNMSNETRKKLSDAKNGKTHSTETRKKISDAVKNRSDETRKKISDALKGKTHSIETLQKMSDAQKGISKKTGRCPHCLMVCSFAMLSRWHLDNCKSKPKIITLNSYEFNINTI